MTEQKSFDGIEHTIKKRVLFLVYLQVIEYRKPLEKGHTGKIKN